jgi:hypothetical protein
MPGSEARSRGAETGLRRDSGNRGNSLDKWPFQLVFPVSSPTFTVSSSGPVCSALLVCCWFVLGTKDFHAVRATFVV